jgi:hypothetical protein
MQSPCCLCVLQFDYFTFQHLETEKNDNKNKTYIAMGCVTFWTIAMGCVTFEHPVLTNAHED